MQINRLNPRTFISGHFGAYPLERVVHTSNQNVTNKGQTVLPSPGGISVLLVLRTGFDSEVGTTVCHTMVKHLLSQEICKQFFQVFQFKGVLGIDEIL